MRSTIAESGFALKFNRSLPAAAWQRPAGKARKESVAVVEPA